MIVIFSRLRSFFVALVSFLLAVLLVVGVYAQTANTTFRITISAASLAVSIVDASGTAVDSPLVTFGDVVRASDCMTATATLGETTQRIRVTNPGASDSGWKLSIAANATTSLWESQGDSSKQFDFNDVGDSSSLGCSDLSSSGDTDSAGGQLTIDPSVATLAGVNSAATTGISKGSTASFAEGTLDSIDLLTAGSNSLNFGAWELQGVGLSQKIPASQDVATDYQLTLVLTVTAQ